ncbi:MAG: hypothetical protein QF921_10385 [Pseudomonadales bacterium]|jgi:hypothetical protein|nr:hypothetical protein [Pseudomonadales bacterium]MDP6469740.1 hypothetical protein [Pseudomonadales bacterium]MDP6827659.1 hypothetical protein [Pseudomonadales bacterium]MDP6971901.1 hypothetical protein [Pseudomonadales bacterium]|tara:strand:+ start:327 stop:947 length:621 start_codon:yes stop_codon:yes gene_type:complete
MTITTRIWIGLALVYFVFFSWYTSFGGPLTEEEIAHYSAILGARGDSEQVEVWRAFMESDTGDDFVMLNAIDIADVPRQVPGVQPGDSSEDVLNRYTAPFLGKALRSAAHPVLVGTAAAAPIDLWGIEGATGWTGGGLVRYRSRRDVMKQVEWASQLDDSIHAYKIAAMEKTIAYPLDPWMYAGDPRLLLALFLIIAGLGAQLRWR